MDGDLGGPAPFVNIYTDINGKLIGTSSDMNGKFTLSDLPLGNQIIHFSSIGFRAQEHTVTVSENNIYVLDVVMSIEVMDVDIIVEAKRDQGGDYVLQQVRLKDASITDVAGKQLMNAVNASDATDVLAVVPSASIEGGKYVYVRGLSDRYSKTLLNGAEIPGLDPNRNSVQLDLFPTNLIDRIQVVKTFRPDLPGDFTGGLIDITTKDFPDQFTMQVSTKFGFNTNSTFNSQFLTYQGGNTDWLGFDDGTRDIPMLIQNGDVPALFENNAMLEEMTKSFNHQYSPIRQSVPMNHGFSFSIGNQVKLDSSNKQKLGFIGGITYSHAYSYYTNGNTGRFSLTGNENSVDALNTEFDVNDSKGTDNVIWGALANLSYMIGPKHSFGFNIMRNQNGISSARYQEGINPRDANDLYYQTRTLQYMERSMTSYQLKGEHAFGSSQYPIKVDWVGSYTMSKQNEPDLRFFTNDYTMPKAASEDTLYNINSALYAVPGRYFRNMEEYNIDTKINFTLPISTIGDSLGKKESTIRWGFSNIYKDRVFTENRYDFRDQNVQYNGNPNDYFSNSNFDLNQSEYIYLQDASELRNNYKGNQQVIAGYLMGDLQLHERVRLIIGARVEQTDIMLVSANHELPKGILNNTDVLPSINFSYSISDTTKLRVAYNRTLARPTFRELAPFASFNFVGDYVIVGNNELERTIIDNVDVRWEKYPAIGEIISFSLFAKLFQNPIERAFNPVSANPELNYRNVDQAMVYGAEFEFKKGLEFVSQLLEKFSLGVNATYVYSRVYIDKIELEGIRATDPDHPEYRPMFGQSPYIINSIVSYDNREKGWNANLSYNVTGEKLAVVIVGGTPNVFMQPRHVLNFNISKKFKVGAEDKNNKFSLKFSVNNILDSPYTQSHEFKGEEYIFQSYRMGQTISIGLKYLIN